MNISGVLHVHSRYSYDADIPLAELKQVFVSSGLRFACVTEHTDELDSARAQAFIRECQELSDEAFLFIPGFEMPYLGTHILLVGAFSYAFDKSDLRGSLRRFVSDGAVAVIAHPHRNGFRVDDLMMDNCIGTEIWNSQYDGKYAPRPGALTWFRSLRERKPGFRALAGIDLHRSSHVGGPHIEMQVADLTSGSVLQNMKEGDYSLRGRASIISSDGVLEWPTPFGAALFGYSTLMIVQAARLLSRLAKALGLQNNHLFRGARDALRKHL